MKSDSICSPQSVIEMGDSQDLASNSSVCEHLPVYANKLVYQARYYVDLTQRVPSWQNGALSVPYKITAHYLLYSGNSGPGVHRLVKEARLDLYQTVLKR